MQGFRINPDKKYVNTIINKLIENDGMCPCQLEKSENTLCPCKKFLEEKHCCCKLYVEKAKCI